MRVDTLGLGIEQHCILLSEQSEYHQTREAYRYRMQLLDLGANEEDVTKVVYPST